MKQPTQEEIQAALRLAHWLEGEIEQEIESDVLEAIYVISPDRCPEPRIGLDDVLGRVEFGPFGKGKEVEGTEEDEEYLRELLMHSSPIPKTSLEDILSRIETGPFANISKQETLEEDVSEEIPDNVVSFRPWWKRTEIALVAAAAVALLILIPSNFEMPEEAEQMATLDREEKAEAAPEEISPASPPKMPQAEEAKEMRDSKDSKAKGMAIEKPAKKTRPKSKARSADDVLAPKKSVQAKPTVKAITPETTVDKLQKESLAVTEKSLEVNEGLDNSRNEALSEAQKDMDGVLGLTGAEVDLVIADAVEEAPNDEYRDRNDSSRAKLLEAVTSEAKQEVPTEEELNVEEPMIEDLADEIVVADYDMAEEEEDMMEGEMVEEIAITQSAKKRKAERKRKEVFGGLSMKKPSSPQAEAMEVTESPAQAEMVYESEEKEEVSKEAAEEKPKREIQERIVDLLSSSEKQTIQGFTTSAQIVNYARQFKANKALAVLWQGTVGRDNQFSIDVLKNSDQFASGQTIYLKRNYQLLVSLLLQEGQVYEAEKYQNKLNALK